MHGKGIYKEYDGGSYEGEFINDQYHGYGVRKWSDGDIYEGKWKEN
jgi:hypothetical protein